jgi:hypothetical protein
MDFSGLTHLIVDVSVAGVCGTSAIHDFGSDRIPGAAARAREREKFHADMTSTRPLALTHRFVPFVVEEFGRLGEHARAILFELASGYATRRLPGLVGSPEWSTLLQRSLRDWRQRFSLAMNGIHASIAIDAISRTSTSGVSMVVPRQIVSFGY